MDTATTEVSFKRAADMFTPLIGYKDVDILIEQCKERAEIARKDALYSSAMTKLNAENLPSCDSAIKLFESISGWRDADAKLAECRLKREKLKIKAEEDRVNREKQAELARISAEKKKKRGMATAVAILSIIAVLFIAGVVLSML